MAAVWEEFSTVEHSCAPPIRSLIGGRTSRPPNPPTAAERETRMRAKRLTLQQRREIFLSLVNTQDQNIMSVSESRQSIIKQYKITDVQLKQIEEEGSDKDWPPLNEAVQAVG
jgi:hypothetical protein